RHSRVIAGIVATTPCWRRRRPVPAAPAPRARRPSAPCSTPAASPGWRNAPRTPAPRAIAAAVPALADVAGPDLRLHSFRLSLGVSSIFSSHLIDLPSPVKNDARTKAAEEGKVTGK